MISVVILNLIDKALEATSHQRFSEEEARRSVSDLALAMKMLVNNLAAEVGDGK